MPIVPIRNVGQYGVITDIPPHELPLNAWSSGSNMHVTPKGVAKVPGYIAMYQPLSIAPYFTCYMSDPVGDVYWVYAGSTQVWAWEVSGSAPNQHHNITRTIAYSSAGANKWQGGMINGIGILNNATDPPQVWNPIAETQLLVNLPNWPANTIASVIRGFKNFLVALDVDKAGVRDPRLVKWSHPAAAGAVPSSWDHTDTTKDAGEYSLADTPGVLLDCAMLRDINVLYKDDSVWAMRYIGGDQIFAFTKLFDSFGCFGKNCAVEYMAGKHFVLAKGDVIIHDGHTAISVLTDRVKETLFSEMTTAYPERSFVALKKDTNEVLVCYPLEGSSYADRALIWNWEKNTLTFQALPNVMSIGSGAINASATFGDWASDADTWDSDVTAWGPYNLTRNVDRCMLASPVDSKLYGVFPWSTQFNYVNFTAEIQREGLGIPFKTDAPPDISSVKFCRNIWPKITGTAGGVVQVALGSQIRIGEAISWGAWKDFTIGTTQKIDVAASGRLFALKFRSTTDVQWELQGYDLDVDKLGDF